MSLAFQDLVPQISPWVASLGNTWLGSTAKLAFAHIEVLHILSFVVLAGVSILLNLRLLGVDLSRESPGELRSSLSPYLHGSVLGILISGVLIGCSNAERLYTSEAFTAKMIGLAAGLVLTYGVTWPSANEGRTGRGIHIAATIGLALWAVSIAVFATSKLINPGLWHLIVAAALMVFIVVHGRTRWIFVGGLVALLAAQIATAALIIGPSHYDKLDPANKAFAWGFVAWIALAMGATITRSTSQGDGVRFQRVMAYAGFLVWITVAAAGRWIAFA